MARFDTKAANSDFEAMALAAAPAETVVSIGNLVEGATAKATPVDADLIAISDSAASGDVKKTTWAQIKTTLQAVWDTLYQPLDSDLTTIAGLTATTDNFIQAKSSAWASRTIAQVKTDLGLAGTNNGDQTSIVGITGTKAQFDTAVTDGNFLYVGDVTSNATHTGEVTGATALTVDKTAITGKTLVTAAVGDHVLVADASDTDNLKKVTVQTIVDLAPAETAATVGAIIAGATAKTAPVDADSIIISDSEAAGVGKKSTWTNIKAFLKTYFDTLYQPSDSDLTTIAGLTATTDSFIQSKSSAWAARTIAQVKTDLGLTGTNSGDQTSIVGITGTTAQFNTANTDGDFATLAGSEVLTNKTLIASTNVIEEITTTTSSATPTPTGGSLRNFFTVTALAEGATFAAPSGSPANGNRLVVRYKDNGTGRSLAYNAIYRAIGVTLKTTTVANKTGYFAAIYNSADSKWDILAIGEEA